MKTRYLISAAAITSFSIIGCDKPAPDFSKKIAELEQKNTEATQRQQQLEQEIQEQKLAAERDTIERERKKIEDDRVELERRQGEATAEKEAGIRKREEDLARREGKVEQVQAALAEKQNDLDQKSVTLSDRDRELAGREALPFTQPEQREPVADYGMFYDSLSSHGSWFETADYGYVWQPVAVRDTNWRPYSQGRWVCSDRGWNWVSEEPFGWATYHYGRWARLRGRGWIWVPGSEWAPSWVSWRENDRHIGWAPLPPETLAYRGQSWDSTVDVKFGIGASWFSFVEIRNFGRPLRDYCLPINGNSALITHTKNITHIHVENRQVICGGPQYRQLSERIGKPLPFYRLEIDQRPTDSRDRSGIRPRIKGDRMVVSAPNVNAEWNDGLKPGRITGRMESLAIDREQGLSQEITSRFRQSRQDNRTQAEETIGKLGGAEKFAQNRHQQLQRNRRVVDPGGRHEISPAAFATPNRPQREIPANREPGQIVRTEEPTRTQGRTGGNDTRPQRQIGILPTPRENNRISEENDRRQQDQTRRVEQQRQTEQAAVNRRQQQQDQQQQARDDQRQQQEIQRQQEQARQQQENQRQEQQARQQQQQETQRQQQQARQQQENQRQEQQARQQQQQETQRQQQQARQQQENQRQQQQEAQQQQARQEQENQRQQQQENQRQKQRENQRREEGQRQQEQGRQRQQEQDQGRKHQEESRQKQDKNPEESRKRNR
jgi:hypothetical protein